MEEEGERGEGRREREGGKEGERGEEGRERERGGRGRKRMRDEAC